MRIHLRLSKTDLDLQCLFTEYNASSLFRKVIRAYLQGEPVIIPLPPLSHSQKHLKGVFIQLDDALDRDVIEWYRSLNKGLASSALKTLIRWSLEAPDLRMFTSGRNNPATKMKAAYAPALKSRPSPQQTEQLKKQRQAPEKASADCPGLPISSNGEEGLLNPGKPIEQKQKSPQDDAEISPLDLI